MIPESFKKLVKDNDHCILFIVESEHYEEAEKSIRAWLKKNNWILNRFRWASCYMKDTSTLRNSFKMYKFIINLTTNWSKDLILKELSYAQYKG